MNGKQEIQKKLHFAKEILSVWHFQTFEQQQKMIFQLGLGLNSWLQFT